MRVVVDANVFVSGVLSRQGVPGRVLKKLVVDGHVFLVSEKTLSELRSTLEYPKIRKLLKWSENDLERFLSSIELLAEEVDTSLQVSGLTCRDPKDIEYLKVAVLGRAECIVSGDKDLLVLDKIEGIPILAPAQLLKRLSE